MQICSAPNGKHQDILMGRTWLPGQHALYIMVYNETQIVVAHSNGVLFKYKWLKRPPDVAQKS